MNRIVLIGNGFDLAHGLKTTYTDFIDDYWEGFMNYCIGQDAWNVYGKYKYDCIELIIPQEGLTLSAFLSDGNNRFQTPNKKPISYNELKKEFEEYNNNLPNYNKIKFSISNKLLLHLIGKCNSEMGWVHIENEYYELLCQLMENKDKNTNIKLLNQDLAFIESKLQDYLSKQLEEVEIPEIQIIKDIIYSTIYLRDLSQKGRKKLSEYEFLKIENSKSETPDDFIENISPKTIRWNREHFNFVYDASFLRKQLLNERIADEYFDILPHETLFLNFNYTNSSVALTFLFFL